MKMASDSNRRYLEQAKAALRRGDRTLARRIAQKIVADYPDVVEGWLLLGGISKPKASLAYIIKAHELAPDDPRVQSALVWAKERLSAQWIPSDQAETQKIHPTKPIPRVMLPPIPVIETHRPVWLWTFVILILLTAFFFSMEIIPFQFVQAVEKSGPLAGERFPKPSLTPTATNTPTITPTPTATATPTNTPTTAPTEPLEGTDPVLTLGEPDWVNAMNNGDGWPTGFSEYSTIVFEDGYLKLTADTEFDGWRLTWPFLGDSYLEVKLQSPECEGIDHFGVMFRVPANANANKGYLFGITCDGKYNLRRWDGQTMFSLVDWTASDAINTGENAINKLGVMAEGENLALYINGQEIKEITNDVYLEGTFGIFVGGTNVEDLTVWVDEIRYWEIP